MEKTSLLTIRFQRLTASPDLPGFRLPSGRFLLDLGLIVRSGLPSTGTNAQVLLDPKSP